MRTIKDCEFKDICEELWGEEIDCPREESECNHYDNFLDGKYMSMDSE